MTTVAPAVNGRLIALAHHSARALVEAALARHDVTFHQGVTLRAVTVAGGSLARDELVAEVTHSLKTDPSVVHGAIDELTRAELLVREGSLLHLTDAGRDLYDTTAAATAQISARLYAGIPAEDLTVAGRVLTLLTERANAELTGS
ncbi:MarR family winged helix-turn-helix transcriptional regulator [Streptomyces sp. NPDC012794]|uniref:MarR family winged helix-turn-helix transcriptional regulator n=1 Tax=Streptomyces sp. NPDC012794 TaxID=3364850 RepID=UPI0036C49F6B